MHKRNRAYCFGLVVALFVVAPNAYGQRGMPVATRGSSQLGGTLRSAINYSGGIFAGQSRLARMSSSAQGFAASSSSAAAEIYGGRPRSPKTVFAGGTNYLRQAGKSSMMAYLGRTQAGVWFSAPTFQGYRQWLPADKPTYGTPQADRLVSQTNELSQLQSYHYRALLPRVGTSIRDSLTQESLQNAIETPANISASDSDMPTHAQRLAARLEAKRLVYLDKAWRLLGDGELQMANAAFGNASLLKPDDLDTCVGQLLSVVADKQFATARVLLGRLHRLQEDIFVCDRSLDDVFGDEKKAEQLLATLAFRPQDEGVTDEAMALRAYMLWLDGQHLVALSQAEQLRDRFRSSTYANMALQIAKHVDSSSP